MHTDFLALLFSSFFLLCFLTTPLVFVCLATFKIKQIFRLSFSTPVNANARERYPFVVRYYWQQKAKNKVRFFIVDLLFRRFIQSTAGKERKREKERKRSSFVCSLFVCAQLRFFLFPENLSSFLFFFVFFFRSARRLNAMRERERERENHR